MIFHFQLSIFNYIDGDVKVSTGTAKLGKRVAVRRRFKSLNLKINDNTKNVALAA